MSEHTPGPWSVDARASTAVRGGPDDHVVASCGGWATTRRDVLAEQQANARLVAAAPDLLAALREIVAMTNEDTGTFRKRGGTYRGLVGLVAEAAIAKAEGA
jgi:hypothetical protein